MAYDMCMLLVKNGDYGTLAEKPCCTLRFLLHYLMYEKNTEVLEPWMPKLSSDIKQSFKKLASTIDAILTTRKEHSGDTSAQEEIISENISSCTGSYESEKTLARNKRLRT